MRSGIYIIQNLVNRKYYIGSAVDLNRRFGQHKLALRKGEHYNGYLQKAWNKYGEQNFQFLVIKLVNENELLQEEQKILDTANKKFIYNLSTVAKGSNHRQKVFKGFIAPNGKTVKIKNLTKFCRDNNLDYRRMYQLFLGERITHRKWTHKNAPNRIRDTRPKQYAGFIDPTGKEITINNLQKFCRDNNLQQSKMWLVFNGERKQHKGWTHKNNTGIKNKVIKTYKGFVNPKKQKIEITNLDKYCKENQLSPSGMRDIKSGRRKSYKGYIYE